MFIRDILVIMCAGCSSSKGKVQFNSAAAAEATQDDAEGGDMLALQCKRHKHKGVLLPVPLGLSSNLQKSQHLTPKQRLITKRD